MKIERINDNQIRCTLTKNDLASRHLKISELAYGNSKAKALFKDMMEQASCELGFESDNMPLMIEAIPINAECIVLIVTKVDDPDELDTRFSKFSSYDEDSLAGDDDYPDFEESNEYSDDLVSTQIPTAVEELNTHDNSDFMNNLNSNSNLSADTSVNAVEAKLSDILSKINEYVNSNNFNVANDKKANSINENNSDNPSDNHIADNNMNTKSAFTDDLFNISDNNNSNTNISDANISDASVSDANVSDINKLESYSKEASPKDSSAKNTMLRIFSFSSLNSFAKAAKAVNDIYYDSNSLYKDETSETYYLILNKQHIPNIDYNRTCNIISEYGKKEVISANSIYFIYEHYKCIINNHAISIVSKYY